MKSLRKEEYVWRLSKSSVRAGCLPSVAVLMAALPFRIYISWRLITLRDDFRSCFLVIFLIMPTFVCKMIQDPKVCVFF